MINEKIKQLRKSLKLSGEKFGDKIGISKSAVSLIEKGTNTPSEQTIKSICREYNVNETWLRTGEGDMFRKRSETEEIHELIESVMSGDDEFIKSIYRNLAKASPEFITLLKDFVDNIYNDIHSS